MARAKITSKGQVTIPVSIRRMYRLETGTEVDFVAEPSGARLVPLRKTRLSDLYGILPATRRSAGMKRLREAIGREIAKEYARKLSER